MIFKYLRKIKVLSVKATKKLVLKYFITYFSILLIPLIIGYAYYIKTFDIVYSDAINENTAILKQASSILDQRFEEADSMANQIIANSYVNAFQGIQNPFAYPNTFSVIRTRDSLTNYNTSNKFILNYFIFFNKSKLVMNNQITYSYDQFYASYMSFKGTSFENWYARLTQKPLSRGLSGEFEAEFKSSSSPALMTVITYTKPLISYGQNDGIIMLVINKTRITDLLSSINIADGGIVFVENKAGDIITYFSSEKYNIKDVQAIVNQKISQKNSTPEIVLNGKKMMVSYIKSPNHDYIYMAVQSKEIVLAKADNLKSIIYIVLLVSVVIGTLIAYIMAKRSAKPLQDIIKNLQMDEKSENIFENIKYAIHELGENNSNLKGLINEQVPILRTTFLKRLLNAEFTSQDEVENVSKYIHLNCLNRVYCIVIFKFDTDINNYDTLDLTIVGAFKQFLKEALDKVIPNALAYDLDEQQVALLLDFHHEQQEQIKQHIEDMATEIKQEMPNYLLDSIFISCGTIVNQLIDTHTSFEKAKLAFKIYSTDQHSNILWYAETGNYTVDYYFPADLQTKLLNSVKAGDKKGVKTILNILFTKNFISANLSTSLQKLFIYELLGNIIKLGNQIGLDEKTYTYIVYNMDNIDKYSDLMQIKIITDSYYLLCEIMNGQLNKYYINSANQITKYIDKHYCDSNISLASIADKFNMNESYLSYIFKEQSGAKLSSYIESLRIRKAQELLENTDLSIGDISEKTGYLSSNTFCRAFKRATGINATTFRYSKI